MDGVLPTHLGKPEATNFASWVIVDVMDDFNCKPKDPLGFQTPKDKANIDVMATVAAVGIIGLIMQYCYRRLDRGHKRLAELRRKDILLQHLSMECNKVAEQAEQAQRQQPTRLQLSIWTDAKRDVESFPLDEGVPQAMSRLEGAVQTFNSKRSPQYQPMPQEIQSVKDEAIRVARRLHRVIEETRYTLSLSIWRIGTPQY